MKTKILILSLISFLLVVFSWIGVSLYQIQTNNETKQTDIKKENKTKDEQLFEEYTKKRLEKTGQYKTK